MYYRNMSASSSEALRVAHSNGEEICSVRGAEDTKSGKLNLVVAVVVLGSGLVSIRAQN